jgi:hypothetical protein
MTLNDKNQHPSVNQKQPGVVFDDRRCFIQFSHESNEVFQYVATDEGLIIDIPSDWASHLHYLLTQGLFDEIAMNQGMDPDFYGDDEKSSEPF